MTYEPDFEALLALSADRQRQKKLRECDRCGAKLNWEDYYERMSGMCFDCAQQYPEDAQAAFEAAEESYSETPGEHE